MQPHEKLVLLIDANIQFPIPNSPFPMPHSYFALDSVRA